MKNRFPKFLAVIAVFVLSLSFTALSLRSVDALNFNNRSLAINSATASASTFHIIKFNFQTTNNVGSLKFEYCTSPLLQIACSAPTGINVSTAVLATQSGETGFSVFSQNTNTIILGRTSAVTGTQANSYRFNNVTNPSNIGSFYLRISSYSSSDGTGSMLDFGGAVGSITRGVAITSEVPDILYFCVGVTMTGSCSSASGNILNLGNFSDDKSSYGTTKFLVGTNADSGYVVRVSGNTLTSGNDIIAALSSQTASHIGEQQFGINLRANTTPPVGSDPISGSGTPSSEYNDPNLFKFNSDDVIASNSSLADNEKYTVSYIVNIDKNQPAGIYNTTVTYTSTATF